MNFIDRFVDWTSYGEAPESYFRWAAISALGAVMRDNNYTEWGMGQKLYPNLFILNIGPPAIGKQLPMRMAGNLIRHVGNTTVIAGSASMQAVIKQLGTHEMGKSRGASCILYSEELSSFYVKDQGTTNLLTDLSDFHENWDRGLISWSVKLKNVCMSLFASSNQRLLRPIFDELAVYGGLMSRTLFVVESKKRHKSAMIDQVTTINPQSKELLENHLKCVSQLKGPMIFEDSAKQEFKDWYETWDEASDATGCAGRMKTHIKKVAMCLCMADEAFDLVIKKRHVDEGIELCTALYKNYKIFAIESGKSPTAPASALIMRALKVAPGYKLDQRSLLRRYIGELNLKILEDTVPTMEKAGLVTVFIEDNETTYQLTPFALELYANQ